MIGNVGSTIVMVPLAINLALAVGGSPTAFALVVALSGSSNIMTVSNPVISMITGPGGYNAQGPVADRLTAGAGVPRGDAGRGQPAVLARRSSPPSSTATPCRSRTSMRHRAQPVAATRPRDAFAGLRVRTSRRAPRIPAGRPWSSRNLPGAQSRRRPACGQTLNQARAPSPSRCRISDSRHAVERGFDFDDGAVVDRVEVGQQLSVVALRDWGSLFNEVLTTGRCPGPILRRRSFRPHCVMTPPMSASRLPFRFPPPACRVRAAQAAPSAGAHRDRAAWRRRCWRCWCSSACSSAWRCWRSA